MAPSCAVEWARAASTVPIISPEVASITVKSSRLVERRQTDEAG